MIRTYTVSAWHCNSYTTMWLWLKTCLLEALSFEYCCKSCHVNLTYVHINCRISGCRISRGRMSWCAGVLRGHDRRLHVTLISHSDGSWRRGTGTGTQQIWGPDDSVIDPNTLAGSQLTLYDLIWPCITLWLCMTSMITTKPSFYCSSEISPNQYDSSQ